MIVILDCEEAYRIAEAEKVRIENKGGKPKITSYGFHGVRIEEE